METIDQLIERKKDEALDKLRVARINADRLRAEAELKASTMIAKAEAELNIIDNLRGLDWDRYSEIQLTSKGRTVVKPKIQCSCSEDTGYIDGDCKVHGEA